MKTYCVIVLLAGLCWTGCEPQKTSSTASGKTNTAQIGDNPLNAPGEYLGAVAKAKKMAEKTVDLASLKNAIQLFYAQEERYPKNLQELVTERYLGALPPPPVGMKFSYNPANGEIKVVNQ